MLWLLLIIFNTVISFLYLRNYRRLEGRIAELELSDMAKGFVSPNAHVFQDFDPWDGCEPVDTDLPDMSEDVVIDDLT